PNLTRVNWSGLTNGLPEILRGMVTQVVGAVKTMNRTISGTTFTPGVAVSAPGVIGAPMIAAASAPMPSVAQSANVSPARSGNTSASEGYSGDYAALAMAVAQGLDGVRVAIDADGIARLVNKSNNRRARR